MELHQIRYFLALCNTLNFARAAERCQVTQPTLTRAIQKLEHELGGELIRRERRSTHLTTLGQLVRPMLQEVLSHADTTRTAARNFLTADACPVRLGVAASLGPAQFAPFLSRFTEQHPAVRLDLVETDSLSLQERLLRGDFDCAVGARREAAQRRLKNHLLYRERILAIVPPRHDLARRDRVRVADLDGVNLLLRPDCELSSDLIEACRRQKVSPNLIYRSEREDWIQTFAAAGAGITIAPEHSLVVNGSLARPVVKPDLTRSVFLIVVAGRAGDRNANLLVRAIRAQHWQPKAATHRNTPAA